MTESLRAVSSVEMPYRLPAIQGQLASALLFVISVVALTIILATHPHISYTPSNSLPLGALGAVGCLSSLMFATCSWLYVRALPKIRQIQGPPNVQEPLPLEQTAGTFIVPVQNLQIQEPSGSQPNLEPVVEVPVPSKNLVEDDPSTLFKQVMISLLKTLRGAVEALVAAHCTAVKKPLGQKNHKAATLFGQGEAFFASLLDKPQIFVSELLEFYSRSKSVSNSTLRRLISAYNSEDPDIFKAAKQEYEDVIQAQDFREITEILCSKQSDEAILGALPNLLAKHLPKNLQQLGSEILEHLFRATSTRPSVLNALQALRQKAHSTKIGGDVETFIKFVLQEAAVSKEQFQTWNRTLIQIVKDEQFKKKMCRFLGIITRTIRILKLLFDKETPKRTLLMTLDETFLLSESNDCLGERNQELQKEMCQLQCEINSQRKEKERIAFIALTENETRSLQELGQEEIFRYCLNAGQIPLENLSNITNSDAVKALGAKYHKRLIAVPAPISDHPFKLFIEYTRIEETGIAGFFKKKAVNIVKNVATAVISPEMIANKLKPNIMRMLPKLTQSEIESFDAFFTSLIKLIFPPILDGAIQETPFRTIFEEVITTEGEQLAEQLERLNPDELLNLESIRNVVGGAVAGIAQAFTQAAQG